MHKKVMEINNQVCPWWLLPTFDNPLRRLIHKPEVILGDLVQSGQTALDVGCGMGYFSLGLARLVGPNGLVIAADLQDKMLEGLRRRAARAGMAERIRLHHTAPEHIGVDQPVDFALAFWMVHEVPQKSVFLGEICSLLKPGGSFLLVEPIIHVPASAFQKTVEIAQAVGLKPLSERKINISRAMLFIAK